MAAARVPQSASKTARPAGRSRVSTSIGAVAVVEDDEAMRQAIRRVLESEGFATEAFASAEAFLATGAASRARCLVLDVRLPGMSGTDLHRHLRALGIATPT